jgi:hypothetical protein
LDYNNPQGLPLAVVFAWAIAKWLAHPEFKGTQVSFDEKTIIESVNVLYYF